MTLDDENGGAASISPDQTVYLLGSNVSQLFWNAFDMVFDYVPGPQFWDMPVTHGDYTLKYCLHIQGVSDEIQFRIGDDVFSVARTRHPRNGDCFTVKGDESIITLAVMHFI